VILLLVEGVLEQEQPEAMMIRLLLFLLLFCGPALARDDGRYCSMRFPATESSKTTKRYSLFQSARE
jgi:hypothetical protein